MSLFSTSLMQSATVLYALMIILIAFVALSIPAMMVPGASVEGVAKAIACYLWKAFGLLLMALSAVQLTHSIIIMELPPSPVLSGLILLFVVGMGILIHMSNTLKHVSHASAALPRLVFTHTIEVLGGFIAVISILSLALGFLLTQEIGNWPMPVTLILLGTTMTLVASVHTSHKNKHMNRAAAKRKK